MLIPKTISHWTLKTLRENLNKIGAKVTRHSENFLQREDGGLLKLEGIGADVPFSRLL